jgi:tetratricopeptide (TPR) repeat protein
MDLVHFADPGLALEALEKALALDPASEPAAQQAFEMHLEAGRRAEALSVLERHLAAAPGRPEHSAWRLHAADIALALGDGPRARNHLEAARRTDPRSPRIAAALAPLLEGAGEWRALTDALETQIQAEADAPHRATLLEHLARVFLEKLQAPRDAFRRLAHALRLDPGRPALRKAIDAAAAQADLFGDLARAYRSAADAPAADARARKVLLRRAAEVWDRDLGQPEKAVDAWRDLVAWRTWPRTSGGAWPPPATRPSGASCSASWPAATRTWAIPSAPPTPGARCSPPAPRPRRRCRASPPRSRPWAPPTPRSGCRR